MVFSEKMNELSETKQKILEVAFRLFGEYGIEGTSIRQIAKESGVNIAAVNYHFESKENLYWELMGYAHLDLKENIGKFQEKAKSTKELGLMIFDYFIEDRLGLRNVIKMMLSENIGEPKQDWVRACMNNEMGPPGGEHIAKMIQKDISYPLNEHGFHFGIKAVFGAVIHWGMMMCSGTVMKECKNQEFLSESAIREDLGLMIEASMEFIKNHPEKFKGA